MELKGKNTLVVGLARTGVALARFLAEAGARVTVTDQAPASELTEPRGELQGLDIAAELGVPRPSRVTSYDLILLSPGVPPEAPWLEEARRAGIPVWGELELASRFLTTPVLAVSGTNGKTTTTMLLGKFLEQSGLRPLVGGNIGTPLISLIPRQPEADFLVLEVSSFQLDTAPSFHPRAAALLNISPDHLDRYPDYEAYVASKAGLFRRQTAEDLKVLNADDPLVRSLNHGPPRVYFFSAQESLPVGAWLKNDVIRVKLVSGQEECFPLDRIFLPGRHNLENIMAALLLALDAGADPEACRRVLADFRGLPHRLEWVTRISGVDYYDDSKGTNVGAVASSLAYFDRPVVLIAGGRDKDSDFAVLAPLIREKVRALILLGEAKERLARAWEGLAPVYLTADLAEAVTRAREMAQPGEVVLLSPACASFDMFRDYAQRGETFQRLVRELAYAAEN
ncbi:MAG: UDP-N-acetylmuramoyl-L-alanine--D-glutamate ligase [Deltaproteobacteria bacterium]|nr:UDP-N-acetylmuramoyl-L-alanine--D-glutamate ligase [Deltaproteobacteria bacterium]